MIAITVKALINLVDVDPDMRRVQRDGCPVTASMLRVRERECVCVCVCVRVWVPFAIARRQLTKCRWAAEQA
jgi:hypothetical protein